ncbi:MAG: hypothetical protein ACK559_00650, partial [bacterium]
MGSGTELSAGRIVKGVGRKCAIKKYLFSPTLTWLCQNGADCSAALQTISWPRIPGGGRWSGLQHPVHHAPVQPPMVGVVPTPRD